jgi:ABC-type transport system involved in cytochrome c biogenesis ATPase subunit
MDNFIKMCLISYKIRVNIPLVIQGEAGVGKTALLRHLT